MATRTALTCIFLACTFSSGANAAPVACTTQIDALSGSLASVADPQLRAVLENDLRHARKEAAEGDEDECADIMAHAAKVQSQSR